jgi:hypothetical protein
MCVAVELLKYIFWVATSRKSSFAFFNAAAFSLCVVIYFAGSERDQKLRASL